MLGNPRGRRPRASRVLGGPCATRVDKDGVIVLFDSDSDASGDDSDSDASGEDSGEDVGPRGRPRRLAAPDGARRTQPPAKRMKLATDRAAAPFVRRQSAIQASAVTAALVDVEDEESSSESDRGVSVGYARGRRPTVPRGRTKRGAVAARRLVASKPEDRRSRGVWGEYAQKRRLSTPRARVAGSEGESESGSSDGEVKDEQNEESEGEPALRLEAEPTHDSRRSLPTARPALRPSKSAMVKATARPVRPPTRPLARTAKSAQPIPRNGQALSAPVAVSAAAKSLVRRQGERLSDVMSFSELQAQERALARFQAQKKREAAAAAARASTTTASAGSKSARRGEPAARAAHGSHATTRTSPRGSGAALASATPSKPTAASLVRAKPRSKAAAKKSAAPLPHLSTELLVRSSLRSAADSSRSRSVTAGASASASASASTSHGPESRRWDPVVHSTSWRGVYFTHAPPNLLTSVPTVPYSRDLDRPLTAYDPTGTLADRCALVPAQNSTQSLSQSTDASPASASATQDQVDADVRAALDAERVWIEQCHRRRVRHVLRATRAHVSAYLSALDALRGDPFDPFRCCDLASHQLALSLSAVERTTAKRALLRATPVKEPNALVGSIRYFIHVGKPREGSMSSLGPVSTLGEPLESAVFPETVIVLSGHQTPLRRASTYIGVRKNVFIEDDPVLRYVPYFGEHAQMSVDPKRYTGTTLDKAKRVTVLGQHASTPDLKLIKRSARDHEVTECLLRAVVRRCGRSARVFAALATESGADRGKGEDGGGDRVDGEDADWLSAFQFVQPAQDYEETEAWISSTREAKARLAEIREVAQRRGLNALESPRAAQLDRLLASSWCLRAAVADADSRADTDTGSRADGDAGSLAMRLAPPVTSLQSNLVNFPRGSGLRDMREYADAKEWFRDLFCRRCYAYDCAEHGILQPEPQQRTDPVLPAVRVPDVGGVAVNATEELLGSGDLIELDESSSDSDGGKDTPGERETMATEELKREGSGADEEEEEEEEEGGDGDGGGEGRGEGGGGWVETQMQAPRRSGRSQTRICSLASASLQVQEQMVERKRRRQQRDERRRLARLLRASDDSEYVDSSFRPVVDSALARLAPDAGPCGAACCKVRGGNEDADPEEDDSLPAVDEMLLTALTRSLGRHAAGDACLLSALASRPQLSCSRVARFLTRREAAANASATADANAAGASASALLLALDPQRQLKRDKRRRPAGLGGNGGSRSGKRASSASSSGGGSLSRDKERRYVPCSHAGPCTTAAGESEDAEDGERDGDEGEDESADASLGCGCVARGHRCGRACVCPRSCPQRMHGCRCAPGACRTKACPCFGHGRECDPDACLSCGASAAAVLAFQDRRPPARARVCGNSHLLRGRAHKKVAVAFSSTHGWGAFALEPIRKGEFVYEYVGGVVSDDEAERRGNIYEMLAVSYLFDVNAEQVVDAMRQGNKIKFANHCAAADGANCETTISSVNGEHRIALFARQDIEVGAELFFDYGYTHDTAPEWSQLGMRNPHRWGDGDDDDDDDDWRRELGVRLE